VVSEGGRFACGQFVFAHKQMDVDAQSGVADDLLAALAARVGGVLALPVKVAGIPKSSSIRLRSSKFKNKYFR
jgi:hypothetical protein